MVATVDLLQERLLCRKDFYVGGALVPKKRCCALRGCNRSYKIKQRIYVGGTSVPKKGAVFFAVATAPTRKNGESM